MSQEEIGSIKVFLAEAIARDSKDIVSDAAERFGVSRQTIHKRLAEMVSDGILDATGQTRGRTYRLRTLQTQERVFLIRDRPAEDQVWRDSFKGLLTEVPRNVQDICAHGFQEIFNNAIEHSSGATITTTLQRTYARISLLVTDDGIGIFKKIKDFFKLADEREAILEIAKGKVTTDPGGHSGEGIFFTSRMFDSFSLAANGLFFWHSESSDDWLMESRQEAMPGTLVEMQMSSMAARTVAEVFEKYASREGGWDFAKTHVPVRLLRVGEENLVSRSQARRMLARFDRFKEVMLDFDGVNQIGQAFADEVFRVYKNQHPEIKIVAMRANADVMGMIQRVLVQDKPPR